MRELNFKGITFYNANVDSSGNDRLIVHFLDFLTENEIYSGKDVLEQFALIPILCDSSLGNYY
jgi:hypothetical protein